MKLWLLLGLAFLVQEPISTGAVLFEAYTSHYNFLIIHVVFLLATLVDVVVGYYLGLFIRKKFGERKMIRWMQVKLDHFASFIGEKGKVVALVVYSPIIFPLSGIFVPWLDISLAEALIFITIGEIIFWYLPEWLLVFGIHSFITNSFTALYVLIIVITLLSLLPRYFSRGRRK